MESKSCHGFNSWKRYVGRRIIRFTTVWLSRKWWFKKYVLQVANVDLMPLNGQPLFGMQAWIYAPLKLRHKQGMGIRAKRHGHRLATLMGVETSTTMVISFWGILWIYSQSNAWKVKAESRANSWFTDATLIVSITYNTSMIESSWKLDMMPLNIFKICIPVCVRDDSIWQLTPQIWL